MRNQITSASVGVAGTGALDEARQFLDGAAAVLPADDWMLARARQTVDGAAVPASPVY